MNDIVPAAGMASPQGPFDASRAAIDAVPRRFATEPRVTVVLGTYNRERYIDEALQSLLAQTRRVDELLVVDDGSTDGTPGRLAKYGPPVRSIRKPNGGRASALNCGLQHATGDWIWFFDDDDVALPDALARMLAALASDPRAMFAYSAQIIGREGADGRLVREHVVKLPPVAPEALFHHTLTDYPFLTQGMLVHRSCFAAVGGFDVRYLRGQDYEFYTRLLRRFEGVRVDGPTFIWRVHDGPRGPGRQQHAGTERGAVWMQYGAMLGRELRERLDLVEFLYPPAGRLAATDAATRRRALVHRMAVMASKGLVDEMLEDFRSAAAAGETGAPGFGPNEAEVCFKAATKDYFLRRFADSPVAITRALIAVGARGGRDILAYLARGLLWTAYAGAAGRRMSWTLATHGAVLLLVARRWPGKVWN